MFTTGQKRQGGFGEKVEDVLLTLENAIHG
jgi:hypothetical protein